MGLGEGVTYNVETNIAGMVVLCFILKEYGICYALNTEINPFK